MGIGHRKRTVYTSAVPLGEVEIARRHRVHVVDAEIATVEGSPSIPTITGLPP
jgi:hypothetical protein